MEKAYMIRNDGKEIPVTQHYYGNIDEITETLYAGEWLYNNTLHVTTKKSFIDLVAVYALFYEDVSNADDVVDSLVRIIPNYPYKYLTVDFVKNHSAQITASAHEYAQSGGKSLITELSKCIINELNQEFLRARFGGMYNSSASSNEMVFRISSVGFNWFNIIWEFVYNNQRNIKSVTIVRDEESTGIGDFYHAKDGSLFNQMPVADFITISGNPVIEKVACPVKRLLLSGAPLSSLKNLKMNEDRIKYRYKCLQSKENLHRSFW